MSAKARQTIANAVTGPLVLPASTVQVTGYPVRPQTPATWDAWPWLVSYDPINPYGGTTTWNVYVVLPAGDPEAMADAVDACVATLPQKLWNANVPVQRAATGQLLMDANSPAVPCLLLTVTV